MRLEQRRTAYGTVIGAGSFVVGVLLVWATTPVDQVNQLPAWRAAIQTFLTANGVSLDPSGTVAVGFVYQPDVPRLGIGWGLPLLLVAFGAALTAAGISGTTRFKYVVENGITVLYGYLGVGLVALLESGARPAIAGITALVLLGGVALYVGSTVVKKLTGQFPFVGIASVWTVLLIGLIVVSVGIAIIRSMLPMVVVGVAGAIVGITLYWAVRTAPR